MQCSLQLDQTLLEDQIFLDHGIDSTIILDWHFHPGLKLVDTRSQLLYLGFIGCQWIVALSPSTERLKRLDHLTVDSVLILSSLSHVLYLSIEKGHLLSQYRCLLLTGSCLSSQLVAVRACWFIHDYGLEDTWFHPIAGRGFRAAETWLPLKRHL